MKFKKIEHIIIIEWNWFMTHITKQFQSKNNNTNGYTAMSFFIFIIIKDMKYSNDTTLIRHEMIHFKQQLELLFIGQWCLYLLFYSVNLIKYKGNLDLAYRNICFEKEAYDNEKNTNYLSTRKKYAWVNYF